MAKHNDNEAYTPEQELAHWVGELSDAVDYLMLDRVEFVDDHLSRLSSRYDSLKNGEPESAPLESGHSPAAGSRPTIWTAAISLVHELNLWAAARTDTRPIDSGIRELATFSWAPEQVRIVREYTRDLRVFGARAEGVLNPASTRHISAPCPACGYTHVYVPSESGERVRVPALTLTTQLCECRACHATWAPDQFLFLARVLECPLPEGLTGAEEVKTDVA